MSNCVPQFPIYIPSYQRYKSNITAQYLDYINVPYKLVVEPDEYHHYVAAVGKNKVLKLDMSYKDKYDYCDVYGLDKPTGSGPARNFIWDHSIGEGYSHHWIIDDNIRAFRRRNRNEKVKVKNGAMFKALEDFVLRYKNIAMSGPNYSWFAPSKIIKNVITMNTRIYSCNLVRNDIPFRWRGRYNEDTILSLDCLKAGWCTILFNAFLQEKTTTQAMSGGNTDELYKGGTLDKSKMLVNEHSDVAHLVRRYNRWHHEVNYRGFVNNKLVRIDGITLSNKVNNYNMKLQIDN